MAIDKTKVHAVGNINSSHVVTIPEVFAGEDLENYSLVELSYNGDVREAKYASDTATKAYLLCAVEVMYDNEQLTEFYVKQGEACRVIHLEQGVRFETSNFNPISGTTPARGQYASWDATAKKFQLSATVPATPVAGLVFQVVDVSSGDLVFGVPMVRLEVL